MKNNRRIEDKRLFVCRNFNGFGFDIWSLVDKPDGKGLNKGERLYQTSCEEQFDKVCQDIESGAITLDEATLEWLNLEAKTDYTPRVLVCEEKHGTWCKLIKSEQGYEDACIDIVKQRKKDGWYYDALPDLRERLTRYKHMTDEEINALPLAMQKVAREQNKEVDSILKQIRQAKELKQLLSAALKANGQAAIELLKEFSDHEYNGVRLENFQGIYE